MDLWALLVWAYKTQKVHIESGRELWSGEGGIDPNWEPRKSTRDGTATLEKFGSLGCRVDTFGPITGICGRVHPDALVIEDCLKELASSLRNGRRIVSNIIAHACQGDYPEPSTSTPVPGPMPFDRAGERFERVDVTLPDGSRKQVTVKLAIAETITELVPKTERHGRKVVVVGYEPERVEVWYCPVEWNPDPSWINGSNAVAAEWLIGMRALESALRGREMKDHNAVGFVAPFAHEDCAPLHVGDTVADSKFAIAAAHATVNTQGSSATSVDESGALVSRTRHARTKVYRD